MRRHQEKSTVTMPTQKRPKAAAKRPGANAAPNANESAVPNAAPNVHESETPPDTPIRTRDRVLQHAMRLFAEQGYDATTIAQIEAAAGLSAGSGALYRHFASKQDILVAGIADIRARIEANRAAAQTVEQVTAFATNDAELGAYLRIMHALVLRGMESSRDLMMVLMRSGRALPPELRQGIEDWLTESTNLTAQNLVEREMFTGHPGIAADPVATAYVLMAPLMWAKVLEWNQGLPSGLTHERIRDAWVATYVGLTGERGDRSALR